MKEVAAILLAAGHSRRIGKFKPLLPFGDTTVIESCLVSLRDAGISEIVVVVGYRADELRQHLKVPGVSFAPNPDPDSEMSVSIARGVEQVSQIAKALLITLVDYPAVDSATISAIVDEWKRGSKLIQPTYEGYGGHPVVIDLAYRNELLHLDPNRGLRSFFETHRNQVQRFEVESPYVARDMDTWEDYLRLHRDVFGRPPDIAFP